MRVLRENNDWRIAEMELACFGASSASNSRLLATVVIGVFSSWDTLEMNSFCNSAIACIRKTIRLKVWTSCTISSSGDPRGGTAVVRLSRSMVWIVRDNCWSGSSDFLMITFPRIMLAIKLAHAKRKNASSMDELMCCIVVMGFPMMITP